MINTEIELILKWTQNCVLTGRATRTRIEAGDDPNAEPVVPEINRPTILKFNITDCKLYVLIVTLQEKYENKLFEWKKCKIQVIDQPATNNLNFLIDPTFNNVNRLFVLAFPNEEDNQVFQSIAHQQLK